MKRGGLIFVIIFLFTTGFSFQNLNAQEKTKEEKEKELKMQEEIDQQKKAMLEQRKALEEAVKILAEHQKEIINEMRVKSDSAREITYVIKGKADSTKEIANIMRVRADSARRSGKAIMFNNDWVDRPDRMDRNFLAGAPNGFVFGHFPGNENANTSWDFSKSIKETSFSKNYALDVEASANSVVMSVNGDCKSGEIRVKIVMPNGKIYSDIVIDESGNLNWRKSFTISETENKDKVGEWKFEISSSKATGYFKISLQTY
jgi:hypothetical protein